jgi:hypothetical protein
MREHQTDPAISGLDRHGSGSYRQEGSGKAALRLDSVGNLKTSAPGRFAAGSHVTTLNPVTGLQPARAGLALLQLQRRYGNRYVQRLVATARQGDVAVPRMPRPAVIQRACAACEDEKKKTPLQAKLVVGQTNDQYEQEADQVAKAAMGELSAPSAAAPASSHPTTSAPLQRKCFCGGHAHSGAECEECRRNRLSEGHEDNSTDENPNVAFVDATGSVKTLSRWLQRQDKGPGEPPKLPSPLGQSITCSVDVIKIAKALGGDRSAALEILNCCESGFKPLPAGCTKDLSDAVRKILGKKPGEPTAKCPPGFHAAKSSTYQGQCCTDSATIESAQNCCPGERANMMSYCCPPGQVAQGLGCVATPSAPSAPAAPTETTPEAPSEPGDYELPQASNVAVV